MQRTNLEADIEVLPATVRAARLQERDLDDFDRLLTPRRVVSTGRFADWQNARLTSPSCPRASERTIEAEQRLEAILPRRG